VSIYTKRNAAVGYLALRALNRRRAKRSRLKLGLYIGLGLISFGILAGVAAAARQRRRGTTVEALDEESAGMDEAEVDETASEIVGEYVTTAPEPIPAT
jgi:hypothetical protein